ncbi:MAG: acyltransferase family protein [Colwellia sp.]|nr:acyltransferase family protein [Colwellia sp.]
MEIDKHQSSFLKGIAILLMLYHHLFAFPDRVIVIDLTLTNSAVESYIASFGKICVYMFLFLTGYGFSRVGKATTVYFRNKIFGFYKSYWLVFILFLIFNAFLNSNLNLSFDGLLFLNFLGLRADYNTEWWFIEPYIFIVMCMPLIVQLKNKPLLLSFISLSFFGISILLMKFDFSTWEFNIQLALFLQPLVVIGFIAGRGFKNIARFFHDYRLYLIVTGLIVLPFVAKPLGGLLLIPYTPLFIFIIISSYSIIPSGVRYAVSFFGQHSMYMWLTHTFFCYYFFQGFIYSFEYNSVIYAVLILLSLTTSYVISVIYKYTLGLTLNRG